MPTSEPLLSEELFSWLCFGTDAANSHHSLPRIPSTEESLQSVHCMLPPLKSPPSTRHASGAHLLNK